MSERTLQTLGIVVTILLHVGLGTAIALMDHKDEDEQRKLLSDLDNAQVIEASLAFKSDKPKTRQPQKKKKVMAPPPEDSGRVTDPNSKPVETKKQPPPDMIDPEAIMNKNRSIDLDDEGSEEGGEEQVEGSADGSEWGTAAEAKGDPYVGELFGRIHKVWKIPTLETQTGEALGCVRLDKEGKITDRKVWQKSGIANLDRSVDEALKNATDMEEPVPPHLINLLTRKGICFRFKLDG